MENDYFKYQLYELEKTKTRKTKKQHQDLRYTDTLCVTTVNKPDHHHRLMILS